ncbi:BnaA09g10590D [Brassica napus]|uniref:BnaA09g10590D protein n=1 Tax=Brassica napus TaxID=3708 RepID=A0A078HPM1_BRANA|nr:BnaA09g10590D [Brassica napus]
MKKSIAMTAKRLLHRNLLENPKPRASSPPHCGCWTRAFSSAIALRERLSRNHLMLLPILLW